MTDRHGASLAIARALAYASDAWSQLDKAVGLLGPHDSGENTGVVQNGVSIEDVCVDAEALRGRAATMEGELADLEDALLRFMRRDEAATPGVAA